MIGIEHIKYSLRNLRERKSRSILTIVSIFIGIMTIFIFISFGWGLYDYVGEISAGSGANIVLVQAKTAAAPGTSPFELGKSDLEVIEKTRGVIESTGMYFKPVQVKQKGTIKYVYSMGLDPKKGELIDNSFGIEIFKGRGLKAGDSGKVVLGYNYQIADKILPKGLDVNDKIEINDVNYKIIGFYESIGNPGDDANVYMTEEQFEQSFPADTSFGMIMARVNIDEIDSVVDRIEKELRKHRNQEEGKEDFFVSSYQDLIETFMVIFDIIIFVVMAIAFISVIVSVVNTANTMVTSVLERIKEIGVMKSIGARNSEIFNIFFFESSFLGFVAGVCGVLVGFSLTYVAGAGLDAAGWGFLSPHYSLSLFLGCIIFATITGAVSGVIPAVQASKLNPVDALRYE